VVGSVRRRSILGDNRYVIFLLHLTVERRRRPQHAAPSTDAEQRVVQADLFDTIRYLPSAANHTVDVSVYPASILPVL